MGLAITGNASDAPCGRERQEQNKGERARLVAKSQFPSGRGAFACGHDIGRGAPAW